TRLQVEHPVTEMITGLDLVEMMIRVAAGEKLPITQAQLPLKGWAIESRVYAEDPFRNFLPSTGRLVRYDPPPEDAHVRVDTGVYEGGEISMFYDPMIAKLITYGANRDEAIGRMRSALDRFHIRGVSHNIPFLASLMSKDRFVKGRLTTNFIAEEYKNGFNAADLPPDNPTVLAAVAAAVNRAGADRNARISGQLPGHEIKVADDWVVKLDDAEHPVAVVPVKGGWDVTLAGESVAVRSAWVLGQPMFEGTVDGQPIVVQIDRKGIGWRMFHAGAQVDVLVLSARAAELAALMPKKAPPDLSRYLLSPMPGLLVSVAVKEGQEIKAGEELAVVEAMNMMNILKAERDGVVKKRHAEAGASLAVDQIILEFA
ncbi:MAG: acetyl/propionyl-CoA carboxylase subunit alpha, partial [Rhodospirillales bacterium]|nr:acetyl/propionyl-CoA carboxylase subunit alpha [Rhodospirillales bacterium]